MDPKDRIFTSLLNDPSFAFVPAARRQEAAPQGDPRTARKTKLKLVPAPAPAVTPEGQQKTIIIVVNTTAD